MALLHVALLLAAPAVTSIRIERTPCFGRCPVYRATLYPDGKISYHGEQFVPHLGDYKLTDYGQNMTAIGRMAVKLGFFKLKDRYTSNWTDLPSTTITITRGKETKSVYCYGEIPEEFWMLGEVIDKTIDDTFKRADEPKIEITVKRPASGTSGPGKSGNSPND